MDGQNPVESTGNHYLLVFTGNHPSRVFLGGAPTVSPLPAQHERGKRGLSRLMAGGS